MGKLDLKIHCDPEHVTDVVLKLQDVNESSLDNRFSNLREYTGKGFNVQGKYNTGYKLSKDMVEKEAISLFRKIDESVPNIKFITVGNDDDNFVSYSTHDKKIDLTRKIHDYRHLFLETLYEPVDGVNKNLFNRTSKITLDGSSFYKMDYYGKERIVDQVEIVPVFNEIVAK